MSVYSFKAVQPIPLSLQEAWAFFSSPANLQKITPPNVHFTITSSLHGDSIYPGQIIEYKIRPFRIIEWYWMTEITHVEPNRYFADEQRYGPYSLWHHQHHFKEVPGGVEMTDIVHYKLPGGWLGELVAGRMVEKKLQEVFAFRFKTIERLFGKWPA
jgi:ligand-binding SRPBCC domain-containing protein